MDSQDTLNYNDRPQRLCFLPVGLVIFPLVLFAPMDIDPKVVGFILYCAREKRDWPKLYDEMCRVAGQGLYQGLRYRDLKRLGFSLGLHHLQQTIELVEAVTDSRVTEDSLGFRSYQDSRSPHTPAFVPCDDVLNHHEGLLGKPPVSIRSLT